MNVVTSMSLDNALEAIEVYKDAFGAKVINRIIMMEDMPEFDEKYRGKVAHAEIKFGDTTMYINDQLKDHYFEKGDNIHFCLYVESEGVLLKTYKKIQRYSELLEGPIEEYWGAKRYSVKDKFGLYWHIYYVFNQ